MIFSFNVIMQLKILFILITFVVSVSSDDDTGWTSFGSPIFIDFPCNDSTDISITYVPRLPPEEENMYNVNINKNFPVHTNIILKLDTEASVTLYDKSYARITASPYEDNTFGINFFKGHNTTGFVVKGLTFGVVPYFKSVTINNKPYCKEPRVGYLDDYISGYQDHAETPSKALSTKCGRRKIAHTGLIVNAAPSKPGDWPWHVALYRLDKSNINYICGGTLISEHVVLTAAHCASSRGVQLLPEVLSIILGKFNLIGGDFGTQEREVHKVILHDKFNYRHLDNDIALLKMRTEIQYTDYIQPACIWYNKANNNLPTNEVLGTIVGWGFDNTDSLSPQLRQTTSPIISESTCIKSNPLFYSTVLNENKFCAGYHNGTSACNGDSGSAFQVFIPDKPKDITTKDGAWFVRGIVSLTASRTDLPICDPEQYVVFTDVAKYITWINNNM